MNYMYVNQRNSKAFFDLKTVTYVETVGEMTIYLLFFYSIIKMIYAIKEEIFVNGLVVVGLRTCMKKLLFIKFFSFVRFIQINRNVHSSSQSINSPGILAMTLNSVKSISK